jgi:hypothetical protein
MFFHFIPIPSPHEGPARDFMSALAVTKYLYVVGALEVVGGISLLAGRYVPLGLALLGPHDRRCCDHQRSHRLTHTQQLPAKQNS